MVGVALAALISAVVVIPRGRSTSLHTDVPVPHDGLESELLRRPLRSRQGV